MTAKLILLISLLAPVLVTAQQQYAILESELSLGRYEVLASSHNTITGQQSPETWSANRAHNGIGTSLKWRPVKHLILGINGYYSIKNPRARYRENRYSRAHLFAGAAAPVNIGGLRCDLATQFEIGRIAGGSHFTSGDTWNYGVSASIAAWLTPRWALALNANGYWHKEKRADSVVWEKYRLRGVQLGIRWQLESNK